MKLTAMVLGSLFLLSVVSFGYAQSKAKTYKYKCPKCSRVVEFASPQTNPKCPSGDGWMMTTMN